MNLCRGLRDTQPVRRYKSHGGKNANLYKKKPYTTRAAKNRNNIKIEISVDDGNNKQQESSVSSTTSMSDPFCGEKNIERCYNRYIAYNSAEQLLRDDKLYQSVHKEYQ